jgi:hypothetical protein
MRQVDESAGLCSTCNHASSCYYHAARGPALFCELFDDSAAPSHPEAAWRQPPPASLPTPKDANGGVIGLCANCAHRETCRHPRPAGGVWHCEDYE